MRKKTTYHITYKVDDQVKHFYTDRIVKARRFISNNFSCVLSCWRTIETKKSYETQRIYRSITDKEPKEWFNNRIKAKKHQVK